MSGRNPQNAPECVKDMAIQIFGHKSPDTDSAGSAIIWAWYLNEMKGDNAEAVLLGEPNAEAAFVLKRWGIPKPRIIDRVESGQPVIIVDTNNPAELPDGIAEADIRAIIDHHRLVGGLATKGPISVTVQPLACTATIMCSLMGEAAARMPDWVKGLMLSCILSDTLEFRSPTTTEQDSSLGKRLASELNLDLSAYASELFAAKSDISGYSDKELVRVDSKEHEVGGTKFRVSVLETTAPRGVLDRKDGILASMSEVAAEDGVDQVLLFIVDILNEESTLLVPNDLVRDIARSSFGAEAEGDTVVLPGIVSRKKQIIPNLKV